MRKFKYGQIQEVYVMMRGGEKADADPYTAISRAYKDGYEGRPLNGSLETLLHAAWQAGVDDKLLEKAA